MTIPNEGSHSTKGRRLALYSHDKGREKKKEKCKRDKRLTICIKEDKIASHVKRREKIEMYHMDAT